MSFGENLRLMRKARNLTQEQFAEALGVSRQAVSKWEADSGYPEAEKLIVISRVSSSGYISPEELPALFQ